MGYHSLFDHPRLDFNDVHNYDDDINAVSNRYANIQNTYTAATNPKPVILGESSTIGRKLMSDGITNIDTHNYYENNDISLHNEIWSSAMSGAMGTGLSWWWENIFWWELGMPNEFSHSNQTFQVFNGLGETNQITIDGALTSYTNSTSYHQYKPLSDFLQNVDLNQPFDSKIYTDAPNGIQAIYNIPQSGGYPGYGWVHNASNTWHTKWVMDEFNNNFEDNTLCSSSATDIFTISGLIPNKTYSVTIFPTRMAGQILPNDFNGTAVSCGGTGCLTVDMDFMLGCDTTDSDFAFIVTCITCTPQQRLADSNPSGFNISPNASYEAFPNPSGKHVMLSCPLTEHYTCVIIDNHGKQVREFEFTGDRYLFNHSILLPGFYLLRIQSKAGVICKKLVIE